MKSIRRPGRPQAAGRGLLIAAVVMACGSVSYAQTFNLSNELVEVPVGETVTYEGHILTNYTSIFGGAGDGTEFDIVGRLELIGTFTGTTYYGPPGQPVNNDNWICAASFDSNVATQLLIDNQTGAVTTLAFQDGGGLWADFGVEWWVPHGVRLLALPGTPTVRIGILVREGWLDIEGTFELAGASYQNSSGFFAGPGTRRFYASDLGRAAFLQTSVIDQTVLEFYQVRPDPLDRRFEQHQGYAEFVNLSGGGDIRCAVQVYNQLDLFSATSLGAPGITQDHLIEGTVTVRPTVELTIRERPAHFSGNAEIRGVLNFDGDLPFDPAFTFESDVPRNVTVSSFITGAVRFGENYTVRAEGYVLMGDGDNPHGVAIDDRLEVVAVENQPTYLVGLLDQNEIPINEIHLQSTSTTVARVSSDTRIDLYGDLSGLGWIDAPFRAFDNATFSPVTGSGSKLEVGRADRNDGCDLALMNHLNIGAQRVRLLDADGVPMPVNVTVGSGGGGGVLEVPSGLLLPLSANVQARGAINGPVLSNENGDITAIGTLALGDANSVNGVNYLGRLNVGSHTVTLHDADGAVLEDIVMGGGQLNADNGILLNEWLRGHGTVNAPLSIAPTPLGELTAENGPLTVGNGEPGNLSLPCNISVLGTTLELRDGRATPLPVGDIGLADGATLKCESGITPVGGTGTVSGTGVLIGPVDPQFTRQPLGALTVSEDLDIGDNVVEFLSTDVITLPSTTNIGGGTLAHVDGFILPPDGVISGYGEINGTLTGDNTGLIIAQGGDLLLGTSNAGSFNYTGAFEANGHVIVRDPSFTHLHGVILLGGGRITLTSGEVNIDGSDSIGGFGTIDGTFFGAGGQTTISAYGGPLQLGAPDDDGFLTQGDVNVVANAELYLIDTDRAIVGGSISLNGGTIHATAAGPIGEGILRHRGLTGHGAVNARVEQISGSSIFASNGTLTLGNPNFADGVVLSGTLRVNDENVILRDANPVSLGPNTFIEGGTLNSATGFFLGVNDRLQGWGTVNGHVEGYENSRIVAEGPLTFNNTNNGNAFLTGELNVGAHTVSFTGGSSALELGVLTTLAGGTLSSDNYLLLESGDLLTGAGNVSAELWGDGDIVATGPLQIGTTTATGINFDGLLDVGAAEVTLVDSTGARLGASTVLAGGALDASVGLILQAGRTLSGFGSVEAPFENGGLVGAVDGELTFNAPLTGTGDFTGSIVATDTYSPGNASGDTTAEIAADDFRLPEGSRLIIDIGGRNAGEYDRIVGTGTVRVIGQFEVRFANGFENDVLPTDEFEVVVADTVQTGFLGVAPGGRIFLDNGGSFVVWYDANSPFGANRILLRSYLAPTPPANDRCVDATELQSGMVYTGNIASAGREAELDCPFVSVPHDVWFRYTAPADGILVLDTCGTNDAPGVDFGMRSRLVIVDGCPDGPTAPVVLACSETGACPDEPGLPHDASVEALLVAGQTVWVQLTAQVGGLADGGYQLNTSFRPPNDRCEDALPVEAGQSYNGNLLGAQREYETLCGPWTNGPDVWYIFTASEAGVLRVSTCGANDAPGVDAGLKTLLQIVDGCGAFPGAFPVGCEASACPDEPGEDWDQIVTYEIEAGETVYIHMSVIQGNEADGNFTLHVELDLPASPADLNCDGAIDGADIDVFTDGMNGPGDVAGGGGCRPLDQDGDGDADLADFALLQRSVSTD